MPTELPGRPADERRQLIALAMASGLAFVALALVVAGGPLPIDLTAAAALAPLHAGVPGQLIDAVNVLGQPAIWDSLVVAIGLLLWLSGRRVEAVVFVAGVIAADMGATVAKVIVGRHRPPGVEVADVITQASYPSGHMTRAVVTAGLLAAMAGKARWRGSAVAAAGVFATLMGIARISVGEHWFTDVVGAVLYGLLALAVVWLISRAATRASESRGRDRPFSPP